MTYSSGGLIQASDFNTRVGGNLGVNASGQLNSIWGGGYGNAGYGQIAVANVSVGGNVYANQSGGSGVTATDWAGLINKLNSSLNHQSGASSGITAPVAGSTITFFNTLDSSLTTAFNNRLLYSLTGTTVTGSNYSDLMTATGGADVSNIITITRTITFGSGDQARYFFNAGGGLTIVTRAVNNNGTDRSASIVTLANSNFNSYTVYANSASGITGNGSAVTNVTTVGYYTTSNVSTTAANVDSTSYYTYDYIRLDTNVSTVAGSNGDNGKIFTMNVVVRSDAYGSHVGFNDSCNVSVITRVDVIYPETTYLANTWGAVVIS